jgi:hypothetical protein
MNRSTIAYACLVLGLAGVCGGCNSWGSGSTTKPLAESSPQIDLAASNKELVVGDTTTLTIVSRNTLGRSPEVKWDASGGKITTEDNGRTARVKFDKPGAYVVNAKLVIDGHVVDQDTVTIDVRPLH